MANLDVEGGALTGSGTFSSNVAGNGTATFNFSTINADAIKVGVFGNNGTLTIGGGSLNANTLLKLYAPGSNGVIDFVASVTLNSQGAAAVIAANTVTIDNGVVVTISGSGGTALVYTNVPNYTGSGGNGSTTGTFDGNGATTHLLSQAPPFGSSASGAVAASTAAAAPSGSATPQPSPTKGTGGPRTAATPQPSPTAGTGGPLLAAKTGEPGLMQPNSAADQTTTESSTTNLKTRDSFRVADTSQLLDIVNNPDSSQELMTNHGQSHNKGRSSGPATAAPSHRRPGGSSARDLRAPKNMDNLAGRTPTH